MGGGGEELYGSHKFNQTLNFIVSISFYTIYTSDFLFSKSEMFEVIASFRISIA